MTQNQKNYIKTMSKIEAHRIIDLFLKIESINFNAITKSYNWEDARKCAIICVEEKMESLNSWKNTYMGKTQIIELNIIKKELKTLKP